MILERIPFPSDFQLVTDPAVDAVISGIRNSWAVHPDVARYLASLTISGKRRNILEFGAGSSSRVFANALAAIGGGTLTSVEERPDWCEEAWREVRTTAGLDAMLVPATTHIKIDQRGMYFMYQFDERCLARGPFDLLFIDAPHGSLGRDGGLHAAFSSLADGCLVVVDDAARRREQRTVRRWLSLYPQMKMLAFEPNYGRGVAVLEKRLNRADGKVRFSPSAIATSVVDIVRARRAIRGQRATASADIEQA